MTSPTRWCTPIREGVEVRTNFNLKAGWPSFGSGIGESLWDNNKARQRTSRKCSFEVSTVHFKNSSV